MSTLFVIIIFVLLTLHLLQKTSAENIQQKYLKVRPTQTIMQQEQMMGLPPLLMHIVPILLLTNHQHGSRLTLDNSTTYGI